MQLAKKDIGKDTIVITEETILKGFKDENIKIRRVAPMSYLLNVDKFFEKSLKIFTELEENENKEKVFSFEVSYEGCICTKKEEATSFAEKTLQFFKGEEDNFSDLLFTQLLRGKMESLLIPELYKKKDLIHVNLELKGIGVVELNNKIISIFNKVEFLYDDIKILNCVKTIPEGMEDKLIIKFIPNGFEDRYITFEKISSCTKTRINKDDTIHYAITSIVNQKQKILDLNEYKIVYDDNYVSRGISLINKINSDKEVPVFDLDIDF